MVARTCPRCPGLVAADEAIPHCPICGKVYASAPGGGRIDVASDLSEARARVLSIDATVFASGAAELSIMEGGRLQFARELDYQGIVVLRDLLNRVIRKLDEQDSTKTSGNVGNQPAPRGTTPGNTGGSRGQA